MKSLKKIYGIYVCVLQPATVLIMTDCSLVISEAVVSMCLKNNIIVSFPPLKLGGCFLFLKFGQRGGSWKNFSEIGGKLKGGFLLERWGFPNCFISFPSEKHVFTTIGYFLSGKLFMLVVINRSILSCHLLFTRK